MHHHIDFRVLTNKNRVVGSVKVSRQLIHKLPFHLQMFRTSPLSRRKKTNCNCRRLALAGRLELAMLQWMPFVFEYNISRDIIHVFACNKHALHCFFTVQPSISRRSALLESVIRSLYVDKHIWKHICFGTATIQPIGSPFFAFLVVF